MGVVIKLKREEVRIRGKRLARRQGIFIYLTFISTASE
jgi:hypothetical protein